METKLTKNDSISAVAKDFNVLVATFEAMLSRNNVWLDYFAAWRRKKEMRYGDTLYAQWLDWARIREPKKWVIAAFYFDEQYIPERIWYNIDKEWNDWLKQNLKK